MVCPRCAAVLRSAPVRNAGGVVVYSAFLHDGPAREAVLRLKYQAIGVPEIGRLLTTLLPPGSTALVPVPRVAARRWRYGVDPALEIARSLAKASGLAVITALRAPTWVHRRAGVAGARHGDPRFRGVVEVPQGAVLVDDVITTGATLRAAARVTGITTAVTFTAALR